MAEELVIVKKELSEKVAEAWSEIPELREAASKMKGKMTPIAQRVVDCMRTPTGDSRTCLQRLASEVGLKEFMVNLWASVPDHVRKKLGTYFAKAWTAEARAAIMRAFAGMDISRLYSLCMNGRYSEVATALGVPESEVSGGGFAKCASKVAAVKDLRSLLKSMWGKQVRIS